MAVKITTGHLITPEMYQFSTALERCGQFSKDNPTTPLRDNPHTTGLDRLQRIATGSVRVLLVCPCRCVNPVITSALITQCCGSDTVTKVDHR